MLKYFRRVQKRRNFFCENCLPRSEYQLRPWISRVKYNSFRIFLHETFPSENVMTKIFHTNYLEMKLMQTKIKQITVYITGKTLLTWVILQEQSIPLGLLSLALHCMHHSPWRLLKKERNKTWNDCDGNWITDVKYAAYAYISKR